MLDVFIVWDWVNPNENYFVYICSNVFSCKEVDPDNLKRI